MPGIYNLLYLQLNMHIYNVQFVYVTVHQYDVIIIKTDIPTDQLKIALRRNTLKTYAHIHKKTYSVLTNK